MYWGNVMFMCMRLPKTLTFPHNCFMRSNRNLQVFLEVFYEKTVTLSSLLDSALWGYRSRLTIPDTCFFEGSVDISAFLLCTLWGRCSFLTTPHILSFEESTNLSMCNTIHSPLSLNLTALVNNAKPTLTTYHIKFLLCSRTFFFLGSASIPILW